MRKLILSVLFLLALPASAADLQQLSSTYLGVAAANLADTPTTNAIPMDANGLMSQLSLNATVTWGTSTEVVAKCKHSQTSTGTYVWIDYCYPDGTYVQCKPLQWRWNSTDSADGLLNLELRSNYAYVKCQYDDAADGTGTITLTGTRARP